MSNQNELNDNLENEPDQTQPTLLSEYDDEDEDEKIRKIEEDNNKYLDEFKLSMQKQGLSQKTINNHLGNVEFFLNNFLLYYEGETMQEGIHSVNYFLGDWFIRKAMWSSVESVKQNITSIKKFYKCMLDEGNITKKDYNLLLKIIKENKTEWIDDVDRYNNNFYSWHDDSWY